MGLYPLQLRGGEQRSVFPPPPRYVVIKVGITNNLHRRLAELNWDFPPGSAVRWKVFDHRALPKGSLAREFEGKCLARLQENGWRWEASSAACHARFYRAFLRPSWPEG